MATIGRIKVSDLEEIYLQGNGGSITLALMAKFTGKFVDELAENDWTDENVALMNEVMEQGQEKAVVKEGDMGAWSVTLNKGVKDEGGKTIKTLTVIPPKLGTSLKNPPLSTGDEALDNFNFQMIMLSRLANVSIDTLKKLELGDFNSLGTVLGKFRPFRSRS